jgi:hypothetical protein
VTSREREAPLFSEGVARYASRNEAVAPGNRGESVGFNQGPVGSQAARGFAMALGNWEIPQQEIALHRGALAQTSRRNRLLTGSR